MLDQPTTAGIARFTREVLVAHLLGHDGPPIDGCPPIPHYGLFVTLRTADHLRGCIGTFHNDEPIGPTLARVVVESTQDSRFLGTPLSARDISALRIEISLLSEVSRIASPAEILIGRHGILLEYETHRGCFLPEVATQYGWDAETFVRQCCTQKMKIEYDPQLNGNLQLCVFTVEKINA
jgi:uncharacterized protein